jgi:cytochrome c oxidase cbb3-type subunit 3
MNGVVAIAVTALTLVNIGALVWLMWWTARRNVPMQGQETTHVWDDDLTEYNNPLPRWWLWLFVITIIFGVAYLLIFPGLGSFRGLSGWTSRQQYAAEEKTANQALQAHLAGAAKKSIEELAKDPNAMATARNLFALNCSTCHGSDARGAKGFPNLTDSDWLWGGEPDQIYRTIAHGRDNAMPAWDKVLGMNGVEDVLAYVLTLSGSKIAGQSLSVAEEVAAGQKTFQTICAACHGVNGKGNPVIGAPNLTDDIWLHGGSIDDIRDSIAHGRVNHMPAHIERLGETRVKLLAAYVYSLSHPQPAEVAKAAANGAP